MVRFQGDMGVQVKYCVKEEMQDVKGSYCLFTGESTLSVPEQLPTRDHPAV